MNNFELLKTLKEKGLIDLIIPFSTPSGWKIVCVWNPFDPGNAKYFPIDSNGNIDEEVMANG